MFENALAWLTATAATVLTALVPGYGDDPTPVYNGYVEADYTYVAPSVTGRIRGLSVAEGDAVTVGTVTSTTHIGAHIDGPSHVVAGAPSVYDTPLDACVGDWVLVHVGFALSRLDPEEAEQTLALFARTGADPAAAS